MIRRLLPTVLLALLALVGLPAPAHAAPADNITALDVRFDVQPDATVKVRYQLAYHFGESGRHGIDFGIATRESWAKDRTKDVIYTVSDVNVTSPTGAPTTHTDSETGYGSQRQLQLHIGDEKKTVDRDETYVITYTLAGALRTFEAGTSEFYWDVTSYSYPRVDRYNLTVTAPGQTHDPKCTFGSTPCAEHPVDGGYQFMGAGSSGVLTTALRFPELPGAKPNLVERGAGLPGLHGQDVTVDVGADGVAHYAYALQVLTDGRDKDLVLHLPAARPHDDARDYFYEVRGAHADAGGTPLKLTVSPLRTSRYVNDRELRFTLPKDTGEHQIRLTFDVLGTTETDGDRARFAYGVPTFYMDGGAPSGTINLPGEIGEVACVHISGRQQSPCYPGTAASDGHTLKVPDKWLDTLTSDKFVTLTTAKDAIPGAHADLRRSVELQNRDWSIGTMIGTPLAMLALIGGALGLRRARTRRDEQFVGTPVGIVAPEGTPVTRATKREVPVRFEPPECTLEGAALVLGKKSEDRLLAAHLTRLAAEGRVRLSENPLMVAQLGETEPADEVDADLWREAIPPSDDDKNMGVSMGRRLYNMTLYIKGARHEQESVIGVLRGGRAVPSLLRHGLMAVLGFGAVALMNTVVLPHVGVGALLAGALLLGSVILAIHIGLGAGRDGRSATGTALREQTLGFQQYLSTAEADQLRFEEARDRYPRYLPWAVLFGCADRWTTACEGAARSAGTHLVIPAQLGTVSSWSDFSSSVSQSIDSPSSATSSSGDSGSSSSSDSFSSGGGGGGTSVGSW